jgi:acetyltransferase-like isoleucine patch superfamily enzyme
MTVLPEIDPKRAPIVYRAKRQDVDVVLKIVLMLATDYTHRMIRTFYWLWCLHKASVEKNVRIHFPLCLEGPGHMHLGNDCLVRRGVAIACAAGSEIRLTSKCTLSEGVVLQTGQDAKAIFGAECQVGTRAILQINGEWDIGAGSTISSYCVISAREAGMGGKLIIGKGSVIGDNTLMDVTGDLTIGDQVAIGPYSIIYTHDHTYQHEGPVAWKGGIKLAKVIIEDGAWGHCRRKICNCSRFRRYQECSARERRWWSSC